MALCGSLFHQAYLERFVPFAFFALPTLLPGRYSRDDSAPDVGIAAGMEPLNWLASTDDSLKVC